MRSIVILFEDQLSMANPVFKATSPRYDIVVLVDSAEPTDQNTRRRLFRNRAMETFADELRASGWQAHIVSVDRREGRGALGRALKWCANDTDIRHLVAAEPSDFSMRTSLERLAGRFRKTVRILNDHRFICSKQQFSEMQRSAASASDFYQAVRRQEGLLMDGDKPEGGRWRHIDGDDSAKFAPRKTDHDFERPAPTAFQAKRDLERFIEFTLPRFGACEHLDPTQLHAFPCPEIEAMLDAGLLNPLTVCHRVEGAYRAGKIPLFAAENAIYHIIGLREFRRGLIRLGEIPADIDPCPDQVTAFRIAYEQREAGLAAQRRLYNRMRVSAPTISTRIAPRQYSVVTRVAHLFANAFKRRSLKVL